MTREVWQEYECPVQKADADLWGDELVYIGKPFKCHWCGGEHVAGTDVEVETFIRGVGIFHSLPFTPDSAEALKELQRGEA